MKAEKIRVALEKIKEAQVKKVILGFFLSVFYRFIKNCLVYIMYLRYGEIEGYFFLIYFSHVFFVDKIHFKRSKFLILIYPNRVKQSSLIIILPVIILRKF